jgi:hypothetical protein
VFRSRRFSRSDRDPELATLVAALIGAIVVVLVSGMSGDNLTKEVQFWLYALLVSGFWLGSVEERAAVAAANPGSLGPLPVPAQRAR